MAQVFLYAMVDYANCAYDFVNSLKEAGATVSGLVTYPHHFDYCNRLDRCRSDVVDLVGSVNSASHIIYLHSHKPPRDALPMNRGRKKLYLFVGDQGYRNNAEKILAYYPRLDKIFYQGSDLEGKSSYPESWLLPAVDTDFIRTKQDVSHMSHNSPIKIAHYPRNPKDKGSEVINRVMDRLSQDVTLSKKFIYDYSKKWELVWANNLDRIDQCDVYIESQSYTLETPDGRSVPMNEPSVTTYEACSLSKAVITCFASYEKYKKEFGCTSEVIPSNSEEELEGRLRRILSLPVDKLIEKRYATREWICKNHGRKPTGLRLKQLLDI